MQRSEGTQCEPTASGAPAGRHRARRAMDGYCRQPMVWRGFCFVGWLFTRVGLRETKRLVGNEWKRIVGEQQPKNLKLVYLELIVGQREAIGGFVCTQKL